MRTVFLFSLVITTLFSFEINIRSGKEANQQYSILHVKSEEFKFVCSENSDEFMRVQSIRCEVPRGFRENLQDIKHPMMHLDFEKTRVNFTLTVTSDYKLKLFPISPPFYKKNRAEYFGVEKSLHWIVVAYKKELPFLQEKQSSGLRFPIPTDFETLPAVGPVDINSLPVAAQTSRDVKQFVRLEQMYKNAEYENASKLAADLMDRYQNSIFMSDFMRYRMKALQAQGIEGNFDTIINLGKRFIRNFTSDEYLPEILLIMANTYAKTGFLSDANYFFDRLINEYEGNYFRDMGRIDYADMRQSNGDDEEAIKILRDVFYSTTFPEAASRAADHLGELFLNDKVYDKAVFYYQKIWDNNRAYLLDNQNKLHEIATRLAQSPEGLDLAIAMNKKLLEGLRKIQDELHEPVMYEIALWLDEAKRYDEAFGAYERYIKEYPFGEYSEEVKEKLDMLFVKQDDGNVTQKLGNLDEMIEKYRGEDIGNKALLAKLQVLYDDGKYAEVIAQYDAVQAMGSERREQGMAVIQKALQKQAIAAIGEQNCGEFASLQSDYGVDINTSAAGRRDLFECYVSLARYEQARQIADEQIARGDVQERIAWLCALADVHVKLGKFALAKVTYDDILALDGDPDCPEIDKKRFNVAAQLQDGALMLELLPKLEQRYAGRAYLLEAYKKMVETAEDSTVKRVYIDKMLQLQKQLDLRLYSPWVELQAVKYLEDKQRLLPLLQKALEMELETVQRARLHYELGNIYQSMGENEKSRQSYERCMEDESMWKSICRDAQTLLP